MSEERFPIITGGSIAWSRIAPHEEQAKRNHGGQSLQRLAERGGLDPLEAYAVLRDRAWRDSECTPAGMARAAYEVFGPELAEALSQRQAAVEEAERLRGLVAAANQDAEALRKDLRAFHRQFKSDGNVRVLAIMADFTRRVLDPDAVRLASQPPPAEAEGA